MRRTRVHLLWREPGVCRQFRTGVSLHSHTMHSRESLSFIPRYASHVPLLAWELERLARGYRARYGRPLDYSRGYWTPLLAEREAHELESRNIENNLGLAPLVSLSDHDNVEAGCNLRKLPATAVAPISLEWTMPIDGTYFHFGIHNLPPPHARELAGEMAECTAAPSPARRHEILHGVIGHRETLVVLNHPLWAQSGCAPEVHRGALDQLLNESGQTIHALELNGLRPWVENRAVRALAASRGYPLVSGGDRHACDPNTMLNLTGAATFDEFAAEVRGGHSVVAIQERYREPRGFRIIKALSDIMGEYPEIPSRVRWSDRVYCNRYTGATVSISELLNGDMPRSLRLFDGATRLARGVRMRNFLRACFGDGAELDLDLTTTAV